jgi:ABC-type polysaccharide transport system permease subunit
MSRRVEELLSKMTLEEKAAQTDMIRGVTLAEKVHPAHFCSVDDSSDFVWERVDKLIGAAGIGFVHDVYSPPAVLNKLQRYFVEKTRLGIPCIFTGEALHGLSWPGAMSFPMPIALALIVNNIRNQRMKKFTQTAIYVPHFISTVVLAGILYILLSPTNGIVNHLITALGGKSIYFMNEASWFRPVYIISGIWQNAGWDSILYIAALAGVDPELYEAATIDGANKWQKVRYIDLPHIVPTATMMLILNSGSLLSSATQKTLLLQTGGNMATSDIIGTYVYTMGLGSGQFSYTAAIGLFVNVVNFILVLSTNKISSKMNGETLF